MDFLLKNWHWAALAVVSAAWLLFDILSRGTRKDWVSPLQATLLINKENAVALDVRGAEEFAKGHLPNAINIPLNDIEKRSAELDKYKTKPLILYCAHGNRSESAISRLRKAGFEKLYNLRGGLGEWEKAGQPLSRKSKK